MFCDVFCKYVLFGRINSLFVLEQIETISPYFILAGLIGVGRNRMIPVSIIWWIFVWTLSCLFWFSHCRVSLVEAFKEITIIIRALIDNNLRKE